MKKEQQRSRALEVAVDLVLEVGLAGLSLRTLARRAQTSDRMLLYYFADKRELVDAILEVLSLRLRGLLSDAASQGPLSAPELLREAARVFNVPEVRSIALVWLELSLLAAREPEVYRAAAKRMREDWAAWLSARVVATTPRSRRATVEALLVLCDGFLVHGLTGEPLALQHAGELIAMWAGAGQVPEANQRPLRRVTRRPRD
jgi:AcrR family transcriptional regulator